MKRLKDHVLTTKINEGDYQNLVKASELNKRKIPDFVRHYLKMSVESVLAVRGQKEMLKLFADEKTITKLMSEIAKTE